MNMKAGAAAILCVACLLMAGCTSSNQDEELRETIKDSLSAIQLKMSDLGQDATNLNYAGLIRSGSALETESQIWYNKISAINDISSDWQPVKTNYLKALDYFGTAGKQASDASLAFQRGDNTAAIQYLEEATINIDKGGRYLDEATAAIPQ
ncbi:MAG: hypothetical protein PHH09_04210 [Methanoregulaceae archaeon]|nr:hypothetical protein [Methanoregulaceae archaeon]HOO91424.1 hypothetical protein [Syntrophales bacterium]HPQ45666.1 hypothetical protein [Syntrophales bacterium]